MENNRIEKGNKKVIRGWVMYDWANSVYNLVISSAIFPIFYDSAVKADYAKDHGIAVKDIPEGTQMLVNFFGHEMSSSVLYSYVLSASFLVVSILSPVLSGIADYSGKKKMFMRFFNYLGVLACFSLYFFDVHHIELGMLSIFLASIGFWNSLVFYNAFLPEIAERKDHDKISARGYSMGYFGSMILLIICLVWIKAIGGKAQWSFVFVGIWWLVFSQFSYAVLPQNTKDNPKVKGMIWKGFNELKVVFSEFKTSMRLKRYLVAFFFFNTGVQTVMLMATIFANKEVKWPGNNGGTGLIISILLIQILGAAGAFMMSRLSRVIRNVPTLILAVTIWIGICIGAMYVKTPVQFYILASCVGIVMGGVQSLARSTYSKLLPVRSDNASYFSFYDVTEKIGIVLGTFFFGFVGYMTGSIRYSVLSVAVFFVLGLIFLLFVPKEKKMRAKPVVNA
jgi:UMF1 family MFS transporter